MNTLTSSQTTDQPYMQFNLATNSMMCTCTCILYDLACLSVNKKEKLFGLASLKSTVITVVQGHDPYINTPVCLPYISYNHVVIIVVIGTVECELVLPVVLNDPIHSVL